MMVSDIAGCTEQTRDENLFSLYFKIPCGEHPHPIPVQLLSLTDTIHLTIARALSLASDIEDQMSAILIPDYESGKFFQMGCGYGV